MWYLWWKVYHDAVGGVYDQYDVISFTELSSVESYQNKGQMIGLLIHNLIFIMGCKLSDAATANIVEVFDINTNGIYNPNTNNY